MSTVLLADATVASGVEEGEQVQVHVAVTLLYEDGRITFQNESTDDYKVDGKAIYLFGSGGEPREFLLNFVLSEPLIKMGYEFYPNPALKFFQGKTKKAGFRFPRETATEASLTTFNNLGDHDSKVEDSFTIFLRIGDSGPIVHDPTIVWDLPGGG